MFFSENRKKHILDLSHSIKLLPFSLISCVHSYATVSLHMAINDVAGEWVYRL